MPRASCSPAPTARPERRSNFRLRVWELATAEVGVTGLRFHELRHTAATLAAANGTSLKALRYQHVIDGQDADIVRYLERFGQGHPWGSEQATDDPQRRDPNLAVKLMQVLSNPDHLAAAFLRSR